MAGRICKRYRNDWSHDANLTLICLDFRRRFLSLLSYKFREFGSVTALSILEAANAGTKTTTDSKSKGWG
jgi:tRNA(Met) C34 N-acetyltransferase TmcA